MSDAPPSREGLALIWCPCQNVAEAHQIARMLVDEGLIACANIIPQIESVFSWEGQVQSSQEAGLLAKTSASLMQAAIGRLAQLHSYDTPAIAGWLADQTADPTMLWLGKALEQKGE